MQRKGNSLLEICLADNDWRNSSTCKHKNPNYQVTFLLHITFSLFIWLVRETSQSQTVVAINFPQISVFLNPPLTPPHPLLPLPYPPTLTNPM